MQITTQRELDYVAKKPECDLDFMALVDETGQEVTLTTQMIDEMYLDMLDSE